MAMTDVDECGWLAAQGCSELMPHRDAIALIHDQEPLVRAEPEGGATCAARDEARRRRQGNAERFRPFRGPLPTKADTRP